MIGNHQRRQKIVGGILLLIIIGWYCTIGNVPKEGWIERRYERTRTAKRRGERKKETMEVRGSGIYINKGLVIIFLILLWIQPVEGWEGNGRQLIEIVGWNIGGGLLMKQDLISKIKGDIIMIQESNLYHDEHNQLEGWWPNFQTIKSSRKRMAKTDAKRGEGENYSATRRGGVVMLVRRGITIEQFIEPEGGRVCGMKCRIEEERWLILCIYAPAEISEEKNFWGNLERDVKKWRDGCTGVIMGGDMNIIEDLRKDHWSTNGHIRSDALKYRQGRACRQNLELKDAYREWDREGRMTTYNIWREGEKVAGSRLDYFWVSDSVWERTREVTIEKEEGNKDHEKQRICIIGRVPRSITKKVEEEEKDWDYSQGDEADWESYKEQLKHLCRSKVSKEQLNTRGKIEERWEILKECILEAAANNIPKKERSRKRGKMRKNSRVGWINWLKKLEEWEQIEKPDKTTLMEVGKAAGAKQWKALQFPVWKYAMKEEWEAMRGRCREAISKVTKWIEMTDQELERVDKRHYKQSLIQEYQTQPKLFYNKLMKKGVNIEAIEIIKEEKRVTEPEEVKEEYRRYFQDLLECKKAPQEVGDEWGEDIKAITKEGEEEWRKEITKEEVGEQIRGMKRGSAGGPDKTHYRMLKEGPEELVENSDNTLQWNYRIGILTKRIQKRDNLHNLQKGKPWNAGELQGDYSPECRI